GTERPPPAAVASTRRTYSKLLCRVVASAHPWMTILEAAGGGPKPLGPNTTWRTPGHRFTMRVWIALPKKAALYTMKYQPEQRFKRIQWTCYAAPRYP